MKFILSVIITALFVVQGELLNPLTWERYFLIVGLFLVILYGLNQVQKMFQTTSKGFGKAKKDLVGDLEAETKQQEEQK